ncbi:similar to Saccharomyces cerevisiae YPL118W MRP51 Mitochondrial ribosomal protein of the small subunit [Maudiozyma saulgeensis]|uniref:Similar to Saccharomyces cerevisiae YPL118W MRP51 Mitochondrial ribosomal protein of the small subunit n=1 Tax=Maudiozyma saulgeensis TaxID=1789683 RepID=A0A1X7R954_9SACH|nr:similar to Saccharomyces cerevisiae YPL118W MRP51 Mitochondrial ribosomal protein of the small subunit [Kazachstania saulgeensis]
MSSVSNLLKNSRVAQLAKSRVKLNSDQFRVKYSPTHQIIETKPSMLSKQEWGLKSNIPNKVKSKYIILDELDTLERMAEFEPIGGTQWTRLRFQEMGIAPEFQQGRNNPLFAFPEVIKEDRMSTSSNYQNNYGTSDNIGDDQLRELCNQLGVNENTKNNILRKKLSIIKENRKDFKKWAMKKNIEELYHKKFNSDELKSIARKYLNERFNMNNENTKLKNSHKFIGTGGLSYSLKGRLRNSPNGIIQKSIVPGRLTNHGKQEMNTATIGGFVANVSGYENKRNSYNKGDFIRESVYPFRIEHISLNNRGHVQIKANGNIAMNRGTGYGYSSSRLMQQQQRQQQQQQLQQQQQQHIQGQDASEKASDLVERLRNMSIN